jgi:Fe-S-cluster containining protein
MKTNKEIDDAYNRLAVRSCGDCKLCCKLPAINENGFVKEDYKMCDHCDVSKTNGCTIYNTRPQVCRGFACSYVLGMTDLKPNKVGHFSFIERKESILESVLTIYCEPENIGGLKMSIRQDPKYRELLDEGWSFVARIGKNENERIIITND